MSVRLLKNNLTVNNKQEYKKPSAPRILGGIVAGDIVRRCAKKSFLFGAPKINQQLANLNNSITQDEFQTINNSTQKALKTTGLDKKGVDIIKTSDENLESIIKITWKELNSGLGKYSTQEKKLATLNRQLYDFIEDSGICFAKSSNKIILPKNNHILGMFHEMGHALVNSSSFGKIISKSRNAFGLCVPIYLISMLKTKKAQGEEPKNKIDKAGDFVKNNAGKLAFLSFAPLLLDEGLATIKGNKIAKEVLGENLAKKVAKANKLGFSTYALLATCTSFGLFLSTKIKDKIAHNKVNQKAPT